ncbi:prohead protease/major capsid protein fusion protein [Aureimonas pseudogalii]|uniref:Prohead serine protease domain-containing protein n=1 Tax=Aureimonas pseudogalii TaxID=1744844 RepID=A0A7W6MJU5_9HYPH|nr:prohead protease/major capsid protein fusion protein [Aureimonas pseudogalii]MBB3998620.1 hypothetical protein [Aureimonas pseudogalii]
MSVTTATRPPLAGTFTRAGTTGTGTWNDDARTVDVIMSSGAAVARRSWSEGAYTEILEISASAVDLSRCDGMSVLDSHAPFTIENRVGTVVPGSARISGGNLIGTVKLSRNTLGESLAQDLRDGHGFSVSVGYRVDTYTWDEGSGDAIPTLTATRWLPMELSIVAIPADAAARTRSHERTTAMNDVTAAPSTASPAVAAERQRGIEIGLIGRRAGMDAATIEAAVNGNTTIADFRAAAFEAMATRQEQTPSFPHSPARTSSDGASDLEARGEALFARANPGHRLSERARRHANLLPAEHARDLLRARGESVTGLSHAGLITRALHATSDFPAIIVAAGSMAVREGYAQLDTEIRQTARPTTLENFKTHHSVNLSSAPRLLKVNEHGEYKRGTFRENAEGYGLSTFGRIIGVTRQLLINDDTNIFSRIPQRLGQSAREFELASLVAFIEGNPTMSDGFAVFSPEHNNLGAGAALSVASLSAARLAMRRQIGLAGEAIGVRPRFLIVPAELETVAEQVLAEIAARAVSDVNPFAGKLVLIVEHRLADKAAWYLAADPAQIDGLEFAHLAGQEGPVMESKAGWDVDGVEIKVRLDYGAGWVDYRAWFKNPGV